MRRPDDGALKLSDDALNAHDFEFTGIDGAALPLSNFRGRPTLVVNTASQCAFTGQYRGLQQLWEEFESVGVTVLGVPCNDFGRQEPGSSEEIISFCDLKFRVTFPMTSKVQIRGGQPHPFYGWLRDQVGVAGHPRWNFYKYLIDSGGNLVDWYTPFTRPGSSRLRKRIMAFAPRGAVASH
ncbi:MAG: glutathione peroxidase [Nitrospina sp.]|nr:glutathione peroxidase [Nitrospina sp.]